MTLAQVKVERLCITNFSSVEVLPALKISIQTPVKDIQLSNHKADLSTTLPYTKL